MYSYLKASTILLTIVFLISCTADEKIPKEQLLLQSITELEKRFEERKLGRIVEYVSENYQDENGRKLKDIKRAIQMQLMRHKTLHVFSVIKDTTWIDDSNVTVEITAAMAGKPIDSVSILTSIRADMIKFKVDFVLEEEVYKVQGATWTWAAPSDFL